MRFHGLMLVRDEADIIAETLTHLLTWVDVLHVYDLGSTDATWDIVQDFARQDRHVVPFKREPTVYSDSLRCILFDRLRSGFEKGDWIVKLDADEFYPLPPREFVKERLSPAEGMVYLQWYFFRLTTTETADYETGRVSIMADRSRSIRDRRRYYKVSEWSEPRMFRYRPTMRWPETTHWPFNAGLLARERLPILHYPHRDPIQMARRFALRAAMKRRAAKAGNHWRTTDWHGDLVDPGTGMALGAKRNIRAGLFGEQGIDTGPLLFWAPGEPLPEVRLHGQIPAWPKRFAQRLAHAALLPLLDRLRPSFNRCSQPDLIAPEENERIGLECIQAEHAVRRGSDHEGTTSHVSENSASVLPRNL
jgi:hypothetical protein